MSAIALATALLPFILRIPDLLKVGSEIAAIIKSDPGTPEEVKAKIAEYNKRLDDALKLVAEARLQAPPIPADVGGNLASR